MLFHEFLDALLERGEEAYAVEYVYEVIINLGLKGHDVYDVLDMPMERLFKELRKPEQIEGWNTYWGEHVVCG